MLRIFAGELTHPTVTIDSARCAPLARGILDRELFHRAFAFRGRFIASPPGLREGTADQNRQALWRRIIKELEGLHARFELGQEIHNVALRCALALAEAGIERSSMTSHAETLETIGPEQIIVDVPALKAEAIRILARYPNGAIKVPEFSFNPVKWSDAYELQKRTGYVFCPREVVPIVGVASKIVFLGRFGVALAIEADGYIKTTPSIPEAWLAALVQARLIDVLASEHLSSKRYSLLTVRSDELRIPDTWIQEDPDLPHRIVGEINGSLSGGLTADHIKALGTVLSALYAFVDNWFGSDQVTRDLDDEAMLQAKLRDCFGYSSLSVAEGTVVGGGKLDLFVADAVLVENKFHGESRAPSIAAPAAGMQGRRYAIALNAQVVIVVLGYRPTPGAFPSKSACVTIHSIATGDRNRVEIRFTLPYGAVMPFWGTRRSKPLTNEAPGQNVIGRAAVGSRRMTKAA
jgi:hypothetical protein